MTSERRTRARRRLVLPAAIAMACALCATVGVAAATTNGRSTARPAATPPIAHVFQIVLENEAESDSFPNKGTELDKLAAQGVFVPKYFGTGHASADNYIAMISGQAQFSSSSQDCFNYHDAGGKVDGKGFYRPVESRDTGCVFPRAVRTLGDQLTTLKKPWRAYMEDMGNTPGRETSPCGQPESDGAPINPAVGGLDSAIFATATDQYATRHNPFVYFHTLIDPQRATPSKCAVNVRAFSRFATDVAKKTYAPVYTFITPNLCNDGHDHGCKGPGAEGANPGAGGLVSANAFLAKVVPQIQASAAYKNHGLIVITFDEGTTDASCCGESAFSTGGGRVGAVLLGPDLHKHRSNCSYNHFSLLRTWEDLFRLTKDATGNPGSDGLGHLAHAGDAHVGTLTAELSSTASPC